MVDEVDKASNNAVFVHFLGMLRDKFLARKQNADNKTLYGFLFNLLFISKECEFNVYNPIIELGSTYGFLKASDRNMTRMANRVFEAQIYNYFVSKEATSSKRITGVLPDDVADRGRFDMDLCLRKFAEHYAELFSKRDYKFIEREGRLLFLSYLVVESTIVTERLHFLFMAGTM